VSCHLEGVILSIIEDFNISIDLTTAQAKVERARNLLVDLRQRYDLSRWEYARKVRIAPFEMPHSQPVLTINTYLVGGSSEDEVAFLGMYLHEQMHCAITDYRSRESEMALEILRKKYPQFHEGLPKTAKNEESSYQHIIVNWLEVAALTKILGSERVFALARRTSRYRKIYETVLRDYDDVKSVLRQTGIIPLPRPQ
jgi:hypothetical protein